MWQDVSRYYPKGGHPVESPTYFSSPVDTTGAGDALFAVTALLAFRNVEDIWIPLLGNLYAGLKTRIIGNKNAVSYVDLVRSVNALMG